MIGHCLPQLVACLLLFFCDFSRSGSFQTSANHSAYCFWINPIADGQTQYTFLYQSAEKNERSFLFVDSIWSTKNDLLDCIKSTDQAVIEGYSSKCYKARETRPFSETLDARFDISTLVEPTGPCVAVGHLAGLKVPGRRTRDLQHHYTGSTMSQKGTTISKKLQRSKRAWMIPGTMWCGAGNKASAFSDLGVFEETDKCCREHDHCEETIASFEFSYGVLNTNLFTLSHCDCDNKFRRCLHNSNDSISDVVGYGYFNVLRMSCFEFSQRIECGQRNWWGMCQFNQLYTYAVLKEPTDYNSTFPEQEEDKLEVTIHPKITVGDSRLSTDVAMPGILQTTHSSQSLTDITQTTHSSQSLSDITQTTHASKSLSGITQTPYSSQSHITQTQTTHSSQYLSDITQTTHSSQLLSDITQTQATHSLQSLSDITQAQTTHSSQYLSDITQTTHSSQLLSDITQTQATHSLQSLSDITQAQTTHSSQSLSDITQTQTTHSSQSQSTDSAQTQTKYLTTKTVESTHTLANIPQGNSTIQLQTQTTGGIYTNIIFLPETQTTASPQASIHPEIHIKQKDKLGMCVSYKDLDSCHHQIPALQEKFGLHNPEHTTLYHCNCTARLARELMDQNRVDEVHSLLLDFVSKSCFILPQNHTELKSFSSSDPERPLVRRWIKDSLLWRHLAALKRKAKRTNAKRPKRKDYSVRLYKKCLRMHSKLHKHGTLRRKLFPQ